MVAGDKDDSVVRQHVEVLALDEVVAAVGEAGGHPAAAGVGGLGERFQQRPAVVGDGVCERRPRDAGRVVGVEQHAAVVVEQDQVPAALLALELDRLVVNGAGEAVALIVADGTRTAGVRHRRFAETSAGQQLPWR